MTSRSRTTAPIPTVTVVKAHTDPMAATKAKTLRPGSCGSFGGRRRDGELCGNMAIGGTKRCELHAGKAKAVAKAEGRLRLAVQAWNPDELPPVDDVEGEAIRVITVTKSVWETFLQGLRAEVMDKDLAALVGASYGDGGKTGEYITGLTELEHRERKLYWSLLADYRRAGFEERRLQAVEGTVDLLDALFRMALVKLGHDLGDPRVRAVVLESMEQLAIEA